jgi:hypothetical protein
MNFFHGVRFSMLDTPIRGVISADAAIPFVVGTSPVHRVPGGTENVNKVLLAYSLSEAIIQIGDSDDWKKYSLCEFTRAAYIDSPADVPVFYVNVYDPKTGGTVVPATSFPVTNRQVSPPQAEIIWDTVVVSAPIEDPDDPPNMIPGPPGVYGIDYTMAYAATGRLVVTILPGGAFATATALYLAFTTAAPMAVTDDDIIGTYDPIADKYTGLQLVDTVFSYYRKNPFYICAPGWAHDAVATAMIAKAQKLNSVFDGRALVDADTSVVKVYREVPNYKNTGNYNTLKTDFFWPHASLGGRIYHGSTLYACLAARVAATNGGIPFQSPSNWPIPADGACLIDGTPVFLTLEAANYLNENGIKTFLNFIGGWRLWGDWSAAFPGTTDPKDMWSSISTMMSYVGNTVTLTTWQFTDRPVVRRLVEQITDTLQLWLNNLVARGALLYGTILFPRSLNPDGELILGHITFAINLTPPTPAADIEFLLKYDPTGLQTLFTDQAEAAAFFEPMRHLRDQFVALSRRDRLRLVPSRNFLMPR